MYKYGDGGSVEEGNKHMLMNQAVQFKHHAEELMNQLKSDKKIDAWVVAKAERAATDLSDITHYLEGRNQQMAKGGIVVPYVVWVSKDGDAREFYGEFKSQRAAEMAMRRIWDNREDYHSIGMLPKITYEKQGFFSKGGLVKDDEVLEMLELAQSSNKADVDEARMRWKRYTKAQKEEFKRLAYEGDAANEDIYEGFLYLISDENQFEKGGITGDLHSLTDELLAQKIQIFIDEIKPIKYYYIDEDSNSLIIGLDENYTQDAADKLYKGATSSMEFFDADSVDMRYIPQKKQTEYSIKLKKVAKFAKGGEMGMGGKVTFQDKVDSISRRLEGTKVPKRLESDYGKKYNKVESMLAARRIAGSMRKKGY